MINEQELNLALLKGFFWAIEANTDQSKIDAEYIRITGHKLKPEEDLNYPQRQKAKLLTEIIDTALQARRDVYAGNSKAVNAAAIKIQSLAEKCRGEL